MISEWEVAAKLQTPEGEILFNQTLAGSDRRFVLNPRRCSSVLGVRTTDDDIPQADGAIPHRRFRTGYQLHLALELVSAWNGGDVTPAVGADLVEMVDQLGLHINSMVRTGVAIGALNARYHWTPTGSAYDRMFDRLQLAGEPTLTLDGDLGCSIYEVDFDTAFPYYIAAPEETTDIADDEIQTITNAGNTDYFPVVEAYGPFTFFELANNTVTDFNGNPLRVVYDSTLPGADAVTAGQHIEFIFFLQSAYLGSGSTRKAGLDMTVSDFWPLAPGENEIEAHFSGGAGGTHFTVKHNHAWA